MFNSVCHLSYDYFVHDLVRRSWPELWNQFSFGDGKPHRNMGSAE